MLRTLLSIGLALAFGVQAAAAQDLGSSVRLQPMPGSGSEPGRVHVTDVRNIYGRCGPSIVHVLGVARIDGDVFTVDDSSSSAAIVVIAPGGRSRLNVRSALSDYNGVACVEGSQGRRLLVWSTCSGTVCGGQGYSFTVVDVAALRVLAGGRVRCDAECARRLTGSDLPHRLDRALR